MRTMLTTDLLIENSWEENSRLRDFIVNDSDNGTLFHRPLFLQYHRPDKFEDAQPIVISFFKKEELIACIAGAVQITNGEKKFISPFASSYGGLVYHRKLAFQEIEEVYIDLLEYLKREFTQIRIASTPSFLSLTGKSRYIDHILLNNGFTVANSDIIMVHELDTDEELLNRLNKKTVTELKQPLYKNKLGLEIIPGVDQESYDLLLQSQERLQSLPTHSYDELQTIERLLPGTIRTFKAYADNRFVAGIIVFRLSNSILSAFYVFDSPEGRALKANHFSYYSVLKNAFQDNYKYLDFGASSFGWRPNYSLISFKEKFDAKPFLRNTFEKRRD